MQVQTLKALKQPLALEDRPDLQPLPGQVVVRLKAASLNRRDYWITQGLYPGTRPPVVPGSDGAGVVSKVGDGVDENWPGQEVIIDPGLDWGENPAVQGNDFTILGIPDDGTFASEVQVAATQLHRRPPYLDWAEAAALPLAGVTAWRALFTQGRLQAGENILITGIGGGVASFALQFAVAAGAHVWVTSSSAEKIERAQALGAAGGFDYRQADWAEQMKATGGQPALIIDSAGGKGYSDLINLVAAGGRIVNYGATAGPPEKLDLFRVFWKQLTLQGSTMGSPDDFAAMLRFVEEHKIRPAVDRIFPFDQVNEALQLMANSEQFGKIVLAHEDALT